MLALEWAYEKKLYKVASETNNNIIIDYHQVCLEIFDYKWNTLIDPAPQARFKDG